MESHAEFLRLASLDADLVTAIRRDYTRANVSNQDRAMLDYVAPLTRDASRIGPADLNRLRRAGFDDRAILQINLFASCSTTSTGWPTAWMSASEFRSVPVRAASVHCGRCRC